jgi:hypothetical protein
MRPPFSVAAVLHRPRHPRTVEPVAVITRLTAERPEPATPA